MRYSSTTVKWHTSTRDLLNEWRATLSTDSLERAVQARFYLEDFEQRIIAGDGKPSGAVVDERTKPTTYWLELSGGTWAQFAEGKPKKLGMFSYVRNIVVINLASRPPNPIR